MIRRFAILFVVLAGCSSAPSVEPRSLPNTTTSTTSTTTAPAPAAPPSSATLATERPRSPLAELVDPVGTAIPGDDEPQALAVPIGLTVEGIGVTAAPVVSVGVLENGEMEIPGRTEVGWYRFGPTPGEPGSAVLAAHIAFDNRAGVFRHLADVELADIVEVTFDDGTVERFEVFELAQYRKTELPFDRVFSESGDPVLTLISCGGIFDRGVGSYEDNIVAYARPVFD